MGVFAQHKAAKRARKSHQPVKMRSDRLVAYTCDGLRRGWSPQLICGRAKRIFPGDVQMSVCPETIYAWIYAPAQKHRQLIGYLPRAHTRRRHRTGRGTKRSVLQGRISIADRPVWVNDRSEFGHWEGDSILGLRGKGGFRTEIERKTRYLTARHVKQVNAKQALDAQINIFGPLPEQARKSTTVDNGPEHALHHKLTKQLGMSVYFANPYHSWERGSNERGNGMIRRYWPKRTDLSKVSVDDLQDVIDEINNRPMALLDYQTPTEAFTKELEKLLTTN